MDEALEFCLLKFAEEQRLRHDGERRAQEEAYRSQLDVIKIKEEKLLFEQKMMAEQIEKKLTLYKQQTDALKAEIERKIKHQLWQYYDSKTQSMEDIISAKKTEYHKWIEEKQQEKSNISDENELLKFNQAFAIEDEYKKKYLQDLSETTRKQLEMEKESLDDNAQAILQIITSSSDEKEWLTNVKDWSHKKFQSEMSNKNLNRQLITTENRNILSLWRLQDDLITRIASTLLDAKPLINVIVTEFKQLVKKVFQDERIEFSKYNDEQTQRLKSLSFDRAAGKFQVSLSNETSLPKIALYFLMNISLPHFFSHRTISLIAICWYFQNIEKKQKIAFLPTAVSKVLCIFFPRVTTFQFNSYKC